MTVIKLKEAKRFIDEAIRNLTEVGAIGAHCWVRNAQIELVKVAEEITGMAARKNYHDQIEQWNKDNGQ
jgi:hypothetical protein